MTSSNTIKLSTGHLIPLVGLGTWKSQPGQVYEAVKIAIDVGYRHFDCAFAYGNETEVGNALREALVNGKVKREDLFITSKLWNTYHRKERVQICLEKSLKALQLDYLDLYLVHWPFGYQEGEEKMPRDANGNVLVSNIDYLETWEGMEQIMEQGLVRAIGVSNFNSKQLTRLMNNCRIKPAMNQVECHPYLNQSKLVEFCFQHGILVTAYSPLGSPDRPFAKPDDLTLLEDKRLKKIADDHGKSVAQVLIRYQVQRKIVCIPKSVTPARIQKNFQVFDFELTPEDMKVIDSFNRNYRFVSLQGNGPHVTGHEYYPFNEEY